MTDDTCQQVRETITDLDVRDNRSFNGLYGAKHRSGASAITIVHPYGGQRHDSERMVLPVQLVYCLLCNAAKGNAHAARSLIVLLLNDDFDLRRHQPQASWITLIV